MKQKYLFAIAMITGLFFGGEHRNIETHGIYGVSSIFRGESCMARELAELPLPHNRYSTTIFRKTSSDVDSVGNLILAENPEIWHDRLLNAFYAKFESPEYIAWSNLPGLPREFQKFSKEAEIKEIRSILARKASPPGETKVILIPLFPDLRVTIDGFLDEPDWESMTAKILIGRNGAKVLLYLVSNGSELYMGCDAIDEKTEAGFDQFRFYIHPDTSYLMENERIHVSKNEVAGIRQTRIKWRKAPPTNENERWKRSPICDWNIYELSSGTWSFSDHKKYEASINLRESGLHLMVPFSAYIEVESDPIYEAGKFKKRVYIGELGTQQKPVWFMIQKIPGEAFGKW